MDKQEKIVELFTTEEVDKANAILRDDEAGKHGRIALMLQPSMSRINKATGQDNNLAYMAYVLEYKCLTGEMYADRS